MNAIKIKYATIYFKFYKLETYTLDFFYKQLRILSRTWVA